MMPQSLLFAATLLSLSLLFCRQGRSEDSLEAPPQPEIMPSLDLSGIEGVLLTFQEGMPAHDRWLKVGEVEPEETLRWQSDYFLIDRIPIRHDDWGIRETWKAPVLLRMAADVPIKSGKHRWMMRVRGLSRLWVDGQVIARSQPITSSPNGEEPMTAVQEPPGPNLRRAEHRQQEIFAEVNLEEGKTCRVILETLIGGKSFRADPGELSLALDLDSQSQFVLLGGASSLQAPMPLHDEVVETLLAKSERSLKDFDDKNRRRLAASRDAYWNKRHEIAREWVASESNPSTIPTHQSGIDFWVNQKIDRFLQESSKCDPQESAYFYNEILPILRNQCFRCHGEKESGGLRLNSRERAMQGGDSGTPALVPSAPERSELILRILSNDPGERMPPGETPLSRDQIEKLTRWIESGGAWPVPHIAAEELRMPPLLQDAEFLRRLSFDTIGLPPTESELMEFLRESSPNKRAQWIDRRLADDRWADHWVSYWQDVLAENPTLINASLNTTGPFRWFLYDSLRDNKPLDRMVTELILLRGSPHEGGSAGFGIAADNDAPLAAKGQILASAFLGIELQCARCHDSPYHSTKQQDLYALAAMLDRKSIQVPKTSRVPAAFFEKKIREPLIRVTLKLDESVPPQWPFAESTGCQLDEQLLNQLEDRSDSREQLAALITSPTNHRFAKVIANRVWQRLMGKGIVEPIHDWEGVTPSHPELLDWLARDWIANGYDMKHLVRLILNSETYQRSARDQLRQNLSDFEFFLAPRRRRLTAEQIVDTLVFASGKPMDIEELTFDPDGRRPSSSRLTLGVPNRAWMLANLANERDRPTLGLPKARAFTDMLETFGWTGARQNPRTEREIAPNVLQPGILANSSATTLLTRAVNMGDLAQLAIETTDPETLVDQLFLRYLSRYPTEQEKEPLASALAIGFQDRIHLRPPSLERDPPLPRVTWSNHLQSEANRVSLEMEQRAIRGPHPDPRLQVEWREVYEDIVWSIVNHRDFVWLP